MGGGGLDSQLWHACAGGMVQLPTVGAKVIYFPQGHGEQAATTPEFPRSMGPSGTVICRVTSVLYLADTETDEVYARLMLQPEGPGMPAEEQQQQQPSHEKPASFAKTLTQSDANNGGGFSVPRYCAETIFPPLDYSVDPPVQTVLAKDVHGETWKFRHIYRGTPRRHLLTTGWSAFVNQKKLVAGDAIVFLRSAGGEAPGDLCVGVRRSMRGAAGGAGDRESWHSGPGAGRGLPRWEVKGSENLNFGEFLGGENAGGGRAGHGTNSVSSFARNRARVTARSVLEAASLAVAGHPFEVVYYPRASTAEFCVKAAAVKAALDQRWYPGMRFKMAFETEDSSRISWFMGTISAVQPADPVLWPNSPWRVLQVTWDEPDLLQGVSRVSPWQVELVSTLPMQLPPFGLTKKNPRILDYPLQAQAAVMAVPMAALATTTHMSAWRGLVEDVSAGMQEARQERNDGQALFRAKKAQGGIVLDPYYRQDQVGVANHGLSLYTAASTALQQQNGSRVSGKMTSFIGLGSTGQASSAGNGSSTRSTPFVLFGQAIDLTSKVRAAVKPKQQDSGGGSSDEQTVHTWAGDSGQARGSTPYGLNRSQVEHLMQLSPGNTVKDGSGGGSNSAGPKWCKEQDLFVFGVAGDKSVLDSFSHCKVFKDAEEVGRTVDLAIFSDYDELFGRLASMFSMDKMELQKNLVYRNAEGSTLQVGYEPYRNFMQSVRRLTILPDEGTCCAAT